jgi:hypothetical protein
MRDIETIDSKLRLVIAPPGGRGQGGPLRSIDAADALLGGFSNGCPQYVSI